MINYNAWTRTVSLICILVFAVSVGLLCAQQEPVSVEADARAPISIGEPSPKQVAQSGEDVQTAATIAAAVGASMKAVEQKPTRMRLLLQGKRFDIEIDGSGW